MIDKTPSNLDAFPEPVAGQPIPRGWFGRLVRFVNSLILRGDKRYFAVSHTPGGTLIAPSKALIDALERTDAAPASGGSAQDISASVSGSTASVTLSGSTSAVEFVGTGSVTISGNTSTGAIEIHGATSGSGGGSAYPVWGNLVAQSITPAWDASNEHMDPVTLGYSGFLFVQLFHAIDLYEDSREQHLYCYVRVDNREIFAYQRDAALEPWITGGTASVTLSDSGQLTTMVPVAAGSTVTADYYDSSGASPGLAFTLYKDTSA